MPTTFRGDTITLPETGGTPQTLPSPRAALHRPRPARCTKRLMLWGPVLVVAVLASVARAADGDTAAGDAEEIVPRKEGESMIKAITASGQDLGFIKCMQAEIYPNDIVTENFMKDVSFVFDDVHHIWRWVRSSPLMDTTPDGHLPMSISVREGKPDTRGYVSRAARVFSGEEEINVIAWKFKGKGEDSFLDRSSTFNFELCPVREKLKKEDHRPGGIVIRDCALLSIERGVVYDKDGNVTTQPTKKPKEKVNKIGRNDPLVYDKLQKFLKKNRERNGKVDVDKVIVKEGDDWKMKAVKFLMLILMIPCGIWLYQKKKEFDVRSEKIV